MILEFDIAEMFELAISIVSQAASFSESKWNAVQQSQAT